MTKVLQVAFGSPALGGTSFYLLNIYRHLNHSKVQFDFCFGQKDAMVYFEEEINQLGSNIYSFDIKQNFLSKKSSLLKNLFYSIAFYPKLYKLLKKNKYTIVEVNTSKFFFLLWSLLTAKIAGTPIRIAHCHNDIDPTHSKYKLKLIEKGPFKKILQKCGTHFFTCSAKACKWMFPKTIVEENKFEVIPNGIDLNKFVFNADIRNTIRTDLNIVDNFVIGVVARFATQKNPFFALDIFEEILKLNPKAKLLWIGEGELKEEFNLRATKKGIHSSIIYYGISKNVAPLYNSMDALLMPSLFEGFGTVLVEAQANGLNCFASDTITKETQLTPNIQYISLKETPKKWAKSITISNKNERVIRPITPELKKFDVDSVGKWLSDFYSAL